MQKLKKLIKVSDFFNSFQMLRFDQQTEYRTFTGGIVSIGVIITITIAFASMISDTVNRTLISYTYNKQKGQDPPLSVLKTSIEDNFMFGVEVATYNLSSQNRLFDVFLLEIEAEYNLNYTSTILPLQACTRQHWVMLPEVVNNFNSLKAANWLCPIIGSTINLQGKYTSSYMSQFSIGISPCSNSTDPSRPCAPQQEIDAFVSVNAFNKYFNLYYVNSVINPDQPKYKNYYLQDRYYIVFNSQQGLNIDLYLTEIQITSDNSIWPFQENIAESVFNIPFAPIITPVIVENTGYYAQYIFMKDYSNDFYQRKVQKIFVVFSFMGGLIGAIMACLFIINTYTSFAFELSLALQVFKGEKDCKTYQRKFYDKSMFSLNILHFFKYIGYTIVKKIKPEVQSPLYDHMTECRNQILSQLDIKNLIKRIIFLEYSISFIFEDYQLAEMHEEKPTLPRQIKKLRKKIQSEQPTKEDEIEMQDTSKELKAGLQKKPSDQFTLHGEKQKNHLKIISPNNIILEDSSRVNQIQVSNSNNPKKVYIYEEAKKLRDKRQNMRKLKDSAKEGNVVSRKLLQIINYPQQKGDYQQNEQN